MQETRQRIVQLLRFEGSQTVESLGTALHLTRTAVTSHLAALQADGLIRRRGLRPGTGRPSIVYELTPAADGVFPKAYDDFAAALLDEIKNEPGDLRTLLARIADRWIARDLSRIQGYQGLERFERAKDILVERGLMPVLEKAPEGYRLREFNCPVMRLATAHPEVCDTIHRWLEALFAARLDRTRCLSRGDPFSAYTITTELPAEGPADR